MPSSFLIASHPPAERPQPWQLFTFVSDCVKRREKNRAAVPLSTSVARTLARCCALLLAMQRFVCCKKGNRRLKEEYGSNIVDSFPPFSRNIVMHTCIYMYLMCDIFLPIPLSSIANRATPICYDGSKNGSSSMKQRGLFWRTC